MIESSSSFLVLSFTRKGFRILFHGLGEGDDDGESGEGRDKREDDDEGCKGLGITRLPDLTLSWSEYLYRDDWKAEQKYDDTGIGKKEI